MAQDLNRDWQVPNFMASPSDRIGWVNEMVEESESWIKGQSCYADIPKALEIVAGKIDSKANEQRSNLNINHTKYALRKIIATLSDVKEIGVYGSNAEFFKPSCEMLNKVVKAVTLQSRFDRKLRMALQYMAITGTGYLWPRYKRKNYGYGCGQIEFEPLGALDVLPVQMPADNDLQEAYVVTIVCFMPVARAHGIFPTYQASLLPVARRRYNSTVSTRRLDLAERFKYGESSENWANLYCEIRYTFVHDISINTTGKVLPMGPTDSSWSYNVPSLGDDIPDSISAGGVRKTRKAEPEDCLIYPRLRLIISSKGMRTPMYDGPAMDWHGMIPLARYCADDWPWESLGYSLVHDIYSAERARQELERGVHQIAKVRLDPGFAYDREAGLNDQTALSLDPMRPRERVGIDGFRGEDIPLTPLIPQHLMEIPAWETEFINYLNERGIDALLGLNEITNLAQLKLNINSDETDKMLSLMGPLVQDISRGMEDATVPLAEMLKYMILQYYSAKRVMQYVGPDGVTPTTFDFDPATLVPSHGFAELDASGKTTVIPDPSMYSLIERAKMFADNLNVVSVPHTMHEIAQMQEQLKYLQLYRGGFPISPHTVAKKLNISNYGDIEGNTEFEKWVNYKKLEIEMMAKAQVLAQSLMPQIPGMGPEQQPGTGPNGGQAGTGGRPPSGNAPPKLQQKGGSTWQPRTTITESR